MSVEPRRPPLPPNAAEGAREGSPRCLDCFYCLEGLPEARCPECGRPFDLANPRSYTTRPSLVRWRLWLPGLALAMLGGVAVYLPTMAVGNVGVAITIAAPFAIGAIVGYRCRARRFVLVLLGLCALTGVIATIMSAHIAGMFCSLVALAFGIGPMIVGALAGAALRMRLKRSRRFDQRGWLPIILFTLIPIGGHMIEQVLWKPIPVVQQRTTQVIDAPPAQIWRSIRFYDRMTHAQPWLMRINAPQPVQTTGAMNAPGDEQLCLYERGFVRKRLTAVDPERRLAFDVTQQQLHFEHDVRLVGGSFDLEPASGGRTRVTLTTAYEPLCRPRFCWAPIERWVVGSLHAYLLEGIALEANRPRHAVARAEQNEATP